MAKNVSVWALLTLALLFFTLPVSVSDEGGGEPPYGGTTTSTVPSCDADVTAYVDSEYNDWLESNHPAAEKEPLDLCDYILCKANVTIDEGTLEGLTGSFTIYVGQDTSYTTTATCTLSQDNKEAQCKADQTNAVWLQQQQLNMSIIAPMGCEFTGNTSSCPNIWGNIAYQTPQACEGSTDDITQKICFNETGNKYIVKDEEFIEVCEPYDPIYTFICNHLFNGEENYHIRYEVRVDDEFDNAVEEIFDNLDCSNNGDNYGITASDIIDGKKGVCRHFVGTIISLMETIGGGDRVAGYSYITDVTGDVEDPWGYRHAVMSYKKDPGTTDDWIIYDPTAGISGDSDTDDWIKEGDQDNQCCYRGCDVDTPLESCHDTDHFCPLTDNSECWERVPVGACFKQSDFLKQGISGFCDSNGDIQYDCRGPDGQAGGGDDCDCPTGQTCSATTGKCSCSPEKSCIQSGSVGGYPILCDDDDEVQKECEVDGTDCCIGSNTYCGQDEKCYCTPNKCVIPGIFIGELPPIESEMCNQDGDDTVVSCMGPDDTAGTEDDCCMGLGTYCPGSSGVCKCTPNTCLSLGHGLLPGKMCSSDGTHGVEDCKGPDGQSGTADDCCNDQFGNQKCSSDGKYCEPE
ncbi:MAG: hypothetical protein GF416_04255 [Candidatus Altiarchaeales archaeon]|nr:hypothetical protein [Candidatus Altiarchaeales archaeon]